MIDPEPSEAVRKRKGSLRFWCWSYFGVQVWFVEKEATSWCMSKKSIRTNFTEKIAEMVSQLARRPRTSGHVREV